MGIETIFLLVLIIALVIGNLLISYFSSAFNGKHVIVSSSMPLPKKAVEQSFSGSFVQREPLNQKLLLISRQIQELDTKASKLEGFAANTSVEMKGVIEILGKFEKKIQAQKHLPRPVKKKDLTAQEMHKIIYRSR